MATESLVGQAQTGDRLATLRALRDLLAREIDACDSSRDVAALSQRLMDVLEQVAAIEKAQPTVKGTALDELTQRRASKGTPSRTSRAKSAGK